MFEDWNNATVGAHNWEQYAHEADVSMVWNAAGYVSVDLAGLSTSAGANYWPAYLLSSVAGVGQHLYLESDYNVEISLQASEVFKLRGGRIYFFVGYWSPGDYIWYYNATPFTSPVELSGWATSSILVGDETDWSVLSSSPGNTNSVLNLFNDPQQWGFVLVGSDTSRPLQGTLSFDNFELNDNPPFQVIPEPSTPALLLMGALALVCWRRASGPGSRPRKTAGRN